ncbi:hypothetical protein [Chryseobacterium sp. KCF3-3]|uniref:hypothetical protein n=1 Tax=Chryseobacterium sp. KCF3-3 TaxID=3231511 RepID=UPI0038B30E50
MSTPINTILSWFETGDFPTQEQFAASWTSFYHKDESIPMDKVENLNTQLQEKVDKQVYNAHLTNTEAHSTTLAKLDASNLNNINIQAWRTILGVGDLPSNIALIDDLPNSLQGNVYTKNQSDSKYLPFADYTTGDGKILASMIEALGLTELISVTETSLAAFMANNANYQYQKNDMIAIPDGAGNYSLYIYKGGSKTTAGNYIPTGLTNITIAMVQGLQAALDAKMDKPTAAGNYIARLASGSVTWRAINPAASYLTFWNGNDFTASGLYYDGTKFGIGTTTPSEMLHLNNGRLRAKAMVFDDNPESLPYQITHTNRRFYGADLTGTPRMFMFRDFTDYKALWEGFTDAQKNEIKTIANGGWTTGTMSVAIISPPIVDKQNKPYWINLRGANLNLPPTNFKIELCTGASSSADTATVVVEIPASQVQLYTNGTDLTFYYNFKDIPEGTYKLRLWNGVAYYLTSFTLNVVAQVNRVDLNNIVWSRKINNNATSPVITESGASVSYSSDPNVKAMADDSSFVAARKTNQLVGADEDFYMTVEITGNTSTITNGQGTMTHFVGLVNAASTVDLLNQTVVNLRAVQKYWYPFTVFFPDNSSNSLVNNSGNTYGLSVIFMRRGGSWTIIITINNQTLLYTKTGYTGAISFGMYNQNTAAATGISVNIVELYKF